nr:unnamed protein product [Callosobruchus chinensis]
MKCLIIVAAILVSAQARHLEAWEQFKIEHGKTYGSLLEEQERFSVFQSNLRDIEEHNERYERGEVSYMMKINEFGDMTKEEFAATLVLQTPKLDDTAVTFKDEGGDIPDSVDWRKVGAVTDVKRQHKCGACWAFSTVGALEGQVFIHNKKLESLSAQNLVDCANGEYLNHGCEKGLQTEAFRYIKDHGVLTDKEYPYTDTLGECRKQGGLKISGFGIVPQGNETALKPAIATVGPIAATLDARGFQFYHKGILDNSHCSTSFDDLNHAILLVGYENNYYIAKNSYGATWGRDGYLRILMGNNTCGISWYNSYPTL